MSPCRTLERGSHRWRERREARIVALAPRFGQKSCRTLLERLARQTLEGNAWHAGGRTRQGRAGAASAHSALHHPPRAPKARPSQVSCSTADHIVAVYQGGGLCDLDNLRTLCVVCHAVSACSPLPDRSSHQASGRGCRGACLARCFWGDMIFSDRFTTCCSRYVPSTRVASGCCHASHWVTSCFQLSTTPSKHVNTKGS